MTYMPKTNTEDIIDGYIPYTYLFVTNVYLTSKHCGLLCLPIYAFRNSEKYYFISKQQLRLFNIPNVIQMYFEYFDSYMNHKQTISSY